MRLRSIWSSLLVAVAAGALPAQDDEGVIIEDDDAGGIPCVVSLSDGQLLRGSIELGSGRRLRVFDVEHGRSRYLDLDRIRSIRTQIESEKLEEAWAFEEEGFRKKIRLGWHYPLRKYRQEVELDSGQIVVGHCHAAVFWIDDGSRERKFILPRVQKGKRDQKPDDLVYPMGITLNPGSGTTTRVGSRPSRPFAELSGSLPGLTELTVVEISSRLGVNAAVRKGGRYRVDGLLTGDHAVFLRYDKGDGASEVLAGMPPAAKMPAADRESLEARIAEIAEFFEEKRIALVGGPADRPWVLLEMRRTGGTTLGAKGGSMRVEREELWALRRVGARWKVESRIFLGRRLVPPGAKYSRQEYRRVPQLWNLQLESGANELPTAVGEGRP